MIAVICLVTTLCQVGKVESVRVFPGGDLAKYEFFVASTSNIKGGVKVLAEDLCFAVGPTRKLLFDNGTSKLDPPLLSFLEFGNKNECGFIKPKILPSPYCRQDAAKEPDKDDKIFEFNTTASPPQIPMVFGSFRIGNGLKQLGFKLNIHPFFNDFRVTIRHHGTMVTSILDGVAGCVGGKVEVDPKTPDTYNLVPDVEEIRKRAIATMEYFTPRPGDEFIHSADNAKLELLKGLPYEDMKRWIDAVKKRDRIQIGNDDWSKSLVALRKAHLDRMTNSKGKESYFGQYPRSDFERMPLYLELGEHLGFGLVMVSPNGHEYWI